MVRRYGLLALFGLAYVGAVLAVTVAIAGLAQLTARLLGR